jgi:hypothetical protein
VKDAIPTLAIFEKNWKWNGPQRIKTILLKLAHGRLMTNVEWFRRNMTEFDSCPICNTDQETVMHVIRDCHVASNTWNCFVSQDAWNLWMLSSLI